MRDSEFNPLHPDYVVRNRGWKKVENPFSILKPQRGHSYSDKHIFIYSDQVFYIVDATTNMLSKARRNIEGSNSETISTSENDGERPLFYSWLNKYFANVERMLNAYIMKPNHITQDNALKEWKERELWLKMPDYWDGTTYDSLVDAINKYLADGVLYEYYKIRFTSKDPITLDKLEDLNSSEENIIDLSNMVKPGKLQPIAKPFG